MVSGHQHRMTVIKQHLDCNYDIYLGHSVLDPSIFRSDKDQLVRPRG